MSLYWDWDREVASWQERRDAEAQPRRSALADKGVITLPSKHRHHNCGDDRNCYNVEACDRNVYIIILYKFYFG